MGRIKSLLVKRTAKQLLETKSDIFTSDFDYNKKILGSTMPSKPIRNRIAGYIAHLQKMKQKLAKAPQN